MSMQEFLSRINAQEYLEGGGWDCLLRVRICRSPSGIFSYRHSRETIGIQEVMGPGVPMLRD